MMVTWHSSVMSSAPCRLTFVLASSCYSVMCSAFWKKLSSSVRAVYLPVTGPS